ncbi:MAG TPA: DoxX family membrane protein [Candidatus Saccharimonadales bacterium]
MKPSELLNKLTNTRLPSLLLRLGLATVFIYAAVASFIDPNEWIGYLPSLLTDHVDAKTILPFFSVFELTLAAWLLSGVYVRFAGLLAAAALIGIVVFNFSLFAISFRDIGLAFAALALASMPE